MKELEHQYTVLHEQSKKGTPGRGVCLETLNNKTKQKYPNFTNSIEARSTQRVDKARNIITSNQLNEANLLNYDAPSQRQLSSFHVPNQHLSSQQFRTILIAFC